MKTYLSILALLSTALLGAAEVEMLPLNDISIVEKVDFDTFAIDSRCINTRNVHEDVALLFNENGYSVVEQNGIVPVKGYDIDPALRSMEIKDFAKLAALKNIRLSKLSNGDYTVNVDGSLKGGGLLGASIGAQIGIVTTNIVGHGVLMFISSFSGPAAPAVYAGLAATYGPAIAGAAKVVGVGVGMAGAVATGPA